MRDSAGRSARRGRASRTTSLLGPSAPRPLGLSAFTIVELIVVVTVIVIILAIAIPGLSAMSAEAQLSATAQTLTGVLTRAHVAALADMNMTAVRIVDSRWERFESEQAEDQGERQHAVTYSYHCATENPANPINVLYTERFVRREGSPSVRLPASTWVAPVEGMSTNPAISGAVLGGRISQFQLDAANGAFFTPGDFLIVFDPQSGVRPGMHTNPATQPWPKYALVGADYTTPTNVTENAGLQRYNSSGLVLYRRDPFLALGPNASAEERQEFLQRFGKPYFVHRFSGALVMGEKASQ